MAQESTSPALQQMVKSMQATNKSVSLSDFDSRAIVNAQDSMYEKGCVLIFPSLDNVNNFLGIEQFAARPGMAKAEAPFILVDTEKHGPKKVFVSQLTRTIMPYEEEDGEIVQKGTAVHGSGPLFDKLSTLRDAGSVIRELCGKKIIVSEVKSVKTARYSNGTIVGLRNAQVPVFQYQ